MSTIIINGISIDPAAPKPALAALAPDFALVVRLA